MVVHIVNHIDVGLIAQYGEGRTRACLGVHQSVDAPRERFVVELREGQGAEVGGSVCLQLGGQRGCVGVGVHVVVVPGDGLSPVFVHHMIGVGDGVSQVELLCFSAGLRSRRSQCVGQCGERGECAVMVEAGHQSHVSVAVVEHHVGGIGHIERNLVVAGGVEACCLLLQAERVAVVGACPSALRIQGHGTHVGGEVAGVVFLALHLHVVGVEPVAPFGKMLRLCFFARKGIVFGPRFALVEIAHLAVDVEVGPQIPQLFIGNGGKRSRGGGGGYRVLVGSLQVVVVLYEHEGRSLCALFGGSPLVGIGIFGFHIVGDIPVAALAVRQLTLQVEVGQGSHVAQVFGGVFVAVFVNGIVGNDEAVVALHLRTVLPIVVSLHHRTVVCFQCIVAFAAVGVFGTFLGQNGSHDFPSVLVEQHEHGVEGNLFECELARAHRNGLEPVLFILKHSGGCFVGIAVVHPGVRVGPEQIGVPLLRSVAILSLGKNGFLRIGEGNVSALGGYRSPGTGQQGLCRGLVFPILFKRGDGLARSDGEVVGCAGERVHGNKAPVTRCAQNHVFGGSVARSFRVVAAIGHQRSVARDNVRYHLGIVVGLIGAQV